MGILLVWLMKDVTDEVRSEAMIELWKSFNFSFHIIFGIIEFKQWTRAELSNSTLMEFWTCYIYFLYILFYFFGARCRWDVINHPSWLHSRHHHHQFPRCWLVYCSRWRAWKLRTQKKKKKVATKFSIIYIFSITAAQRRAICKSCQTFNNLLASATIFSLFCCCCYWRYRVHLRTGRKSLSV